MNFETRIDKRLYEAVETTYNSENYTGAILDSIHFLGNLIRDKSGLESDGVSLIGQAFGGNNAKIKINRLQTESEKNIQKGIEQILRGIYQAFRNPRSHEKHNDKKVDAESIIFFIDYLVKLIDKSKSQFSITTILERAYDDSFLENDRYAELLVDEIPNRKLLEVFINSFRNINNGNLVKLTYYFKAITKRLSDSDKNEASAIISEQLNVTKDEGEVYRILCILPSEWWQLYSEIARLRVEGFIINSLNNGICENNSPYDNGKLGTLAIPYFDSLQLKNDVIDILSRKLNSEYASEQDYVFEYFFPYISDLIEKPTGSIISLFKKKLLEGDNRFKFALDQICFISGNEAWVNEIGEEYNNFNEKTASHPDGFDNDIPF